MSDTPPPYDIWDIVGKFGGWAVAAAVAVFSAFLNRKKPAAEVQQIHASIDVSEASAGKVTAEARSIEIENWLKLIRQTQSEMDKLILKHKDNCVEYETEIESLKAANRLLEVQLKPKV